MNVPSTPVHLSASYKSLSNHCFFQSHHQPSNYMESHCHIPQRNCTCVPWWQYCIHSRCKGLYCLRLVTNSSFLTKFPLKSLLNSPPPHDVSIHPTIGSRDGAISLLSWLRSACLRYCSSFSGWNKRFFSYLMCPNRLWGPPSTLVRGYCGMCPRE